MAKTQASDELQQEPMISYGIFSQTLNTGPAKARSVAARLGVVAQRMPNGRELLTFAQAQRIARELAAQTRRH